MQDHGFLARIEAVEARMDATDDRFGDAVERLSTQIVQSHRETRDEILGTVRAELKAESAGLRQELKAESAALREEVKAESATLRQEIKAESAELRQEIKAESAALRQEIKAESAGLRQEIQASAAGLRQEYKAECAALREEMHTLHAIHSNRFDRLEQAIEESRRFMKVLYEDLLARITLLVEGRPGPA